MHLQSGVQHVGSALMAIRGDYMPAKPQSYGPSRTYRAGTTIRSAVTLSGAINQCLADRMNQRTLLASIFRAVRNQGERLYRSRAGAALRSLLFTQETRATAPARSRVGESFSNNSTTCSEYIAKTPRWKRRTAASLRYLQSEGLVLSCQFAAGLCPMDYPRAARSDWLPLTPSRDDALALR